MKKLKYIFGLLLISFLITSFDDRDFDKPPIVEPVYTGAAANMTIRQLKTRFASSSIAVDFINDSVAPIIKAYVVGNDESGNIYKQLIVQDSTGGIVIGIDASGISGQFKVGQEVFINLNGLYVGKYGGQLQIGTLYNGAIGRMTELDFDSHVFRNKFPDSKADIVTPKTIKISDLSVNSDKYINTLVRIEGVSFNDGGKEAFAPQSVSSAQDRLVTDLDGKTLVVRTSKYATFAADTLPTGVGTLVGIMGKYNTTWQFTVRDRYDLIDFSTKGTGTKSNPFNVTEALANGATTTSVWTKGYIVGSVKPGVTEIKSNSDIVFSGTHLNNTVVLAPSADVQDWSKCVVLTLPESSSIRTVVNLADHPQNIGQSLLVQGTLQKGSNTYSILGVVMSSGAASEYEFESIAVDEKEILNIPFSTDLGGFSAISVTGSQTWGMDLTNKYVRISGFQNSVNNANEDWLISPALDLTGKVSASLSFNHTINKGDVNNMKSNHTIWFSDNYTAGAAPSTATWTQVTITTYPTGIDWTFVSSGNIVVPVSFLGKSNVTFAFKYLSSTAESASWEIKNLVVKAAP
ncbi:MAG: DUF5689 domain-containing protein [Dysgonomonas sp.]